MGKQILPGSKTAGTGKGHRQPGNHARPGTTYDIVGQVRGCTDSIRKQWGMVSYLNADGSDCYIAAF